MVATDELLLSCSILTFLQHIQHSYIRVCVTDLANYAKCCLSVYQFISLSVCNQSKWNMAKTACLMHLCMCKQQEGVQDYRLLPAMQIVTSLSWLMVYCY